MASPSKLKIAYLTISFPNLSEQFMRREIVAFKALGHEVAVFTMREVDGPRGQDVEGVPVKRWDDALVSGWLPDVLYGSLSMPAHVQTFGLSHRLQIPHVLRMWSGLDTFQYPDANFYAMASQHPSCHAVIVEDAFMVQYAATEMGVDRSKLYAVPNSLDLEALMPRKMPAGPRYVLAVGRFVEKKGFIHLIRAMRNVPVELKIVGYGDLEPQLRREAGPKTTFLGVQPMAALPDLYAGASVCVFPCVRTASGDGDGVPTTLLEAMAMGRPVVASDLLSAACYIRSGENGLLVPPGNVGALEGAILTLLAHPWTAEGMGKCAQMWCAANLDIKVNAKKIEAILHAATIGALAG